MLILIDGSALVDNPHLAYLLSFDGVRELRIEHHVEIDWGSDGEAIAHIGRQKDRRVPIAPYAKFREVASELHIRAPDVSEDELIRAMSVAHIGHQIGAYLTVSLAYVILRSVRDPALHVASLVDVYQALSLIGTHVRQEPTVSLGGVPSIQQLRTEVYSATPRFAIPCGQDWWTSCVYAISRNGPESLQQAEGVFKRMGQALRARDTLHESIRLYEGRAAILEALYHLDVLLTSCVAAFDALARVAHEAYGTQCDVIQVGWQKDG